MAPVPWRWPIRETGCRASSGTRPSRSPAASPSPPVPGAVVRAFGAVLLLAVGACGATAGTQKEEAADRAGEASESADDAAAFGGSADGRFLYEKACASCHDQGFNGAPRLLEDDWPYRDVRDADAYTRIAIAGIGTMPARGGQPDMTDEQVRAAVEYMLSELE